MNALKVSFLFVILFYSCKSSQKLTFQEAEKIEISEKLKENDEINDLINPYKIQLDEKMNEVITFSETEYSREGNLNLLGNLTAFLLYEIAQEHAAQNQLPKVDFALLNFGGLRTDLPKGKITTKHIFEVFPFENKIVLVSLLGKDLELIAKFLIDDKKNHPVYELELKAKNDSIQSFKIGGKDIDKNKTYLLATNDYLANKGDKMNFFDKKLTIYNTNIFIRDGFIKKMKTYKTLPIIKTQFLEF